MWGKDTSDLSPLVQFLETLANHHRSESSQSIPIVAIGGSPGVGKTYFSKFLLQHLQRRGIRCMILPLDDFNLSREERNKFLTEWSQDHFHRDFLHQVLSQIVSNNRRIEKPTYDQVSGLTGDKEILDLTSCDLILFEGLYALCSEPPLDFFTYCDYGIYLEASEPDIVKWKWEREQTKLQPRTPERFARHIEAMLAEYHNIVAPSKKNAHFLIKKDGFHNYSIQVLPDDEDIALKAG